ncbi:DNA-processing protein DprA [Cryptosporangium aurantiacum]|uniref:DNA protecting protein DprA n=1 Tax=Cryptosporangium aurantiacum TaxID=134849 RepID=A0A1M7HXI9_9ACTN|nr:DNA-processing protein DprA [Cryptosporangium aurantiacum]SHM33099.1 DNA protecting protein DprA [Cryptosporangium aurantiacum]
MSTDTEWMATERLAWVALSRLVEPGKRNIVAATAGGARALLDGVLTGARDRVSRSLRTRLRGVDPWERAEADLAAAARAGARAITPVDAEWPVEAFAALAPLAEAEKIDVAPPPCLWVRGPLGLNRVTGRTVSIVGARAATAYGKHVAGEIAYGLAERGWIVVSGGAYGIDGAAHRGALAGGGVTVAVLAGGVDVPYPLAHAGLLDRIAEEGLLISEVPLGESPQRHRFLSRNRLVAALGAGLVVVEAGSRSGTTVTAERAHQLERVLMAVPGSVTSALSVGTHRLIRDYGATLVTSAAEVVEEVGPIGTAGWGTDPDPAEWDASIPGGPRGGEPDRATLPASLHRVLEAVPAGRIVTVEAVALAGRLSLTEVCRALPELRVRGFLRAVEDGYRLTEAGLGPPTFALGRQPSGPDPDDWPDPPPDDPPPPD